MPGAAPAPSSSAAPHTDTVPQQQLADPDSRFALVGGVELHYKEVAAGDVAARGAPVLLLVHGFNGSVFNWWAAAGAGWAQAGSGCCCCCRGLGLPRLLG